MQIQLKLAQTVKKKGAHLHKSSVMPPDTQSQYAHIKAWNEERDESISSPESKLRIYIYIYICLYRYNDIFIFA